MSSLALLNGTLLQANSVLEGHPPHLSCPTRAKSVNIHEAAAQLLLGDQGLMCGPPTCLTCVPLPPTQISDLCQITPRANVCVVSSVLLEVCLHYGRQFTLCL